MPLGKLSNFLKHFWTPYHCLPLLGDAFLQWLYLGILYPFLIFTGATVLFLTVVGGSWPFHKPTLRLTTNARVWSPVGALTKDNTTRWNQQIRCQKDGVPFYWVPVIKGREIDPSQRCERPTDRLVNFHRLIGKFTGKTVLPIYW